MKKRIYDCAKMGSVPSPVWVSAAAWSSAEVADMGIKIDTRVTRNNRGSRALSACAALGLAVALGGCVSYTNVPVPESAPAFKSANHMQSIIVVTRALEAVIVDHSPAGQYSINLPVGTTPETFDKIIAQLPEGCIMPIEGMDEDLPVFHIGRIWIRASDAKVDVVYPFVGADGVAVDQNVTVWLSGGVRSWRVYRQQHWAAGTIPTPPMYVPMTAHEEVVDESGDEAIEEKVVETEVIDDGIKEIPIEQGEDE